MPRALNLCALAAAMALLLFTSTTQADALITDFNNFTSDALYPSWALPTATVESGADSYSITAIGYGSNYKYIEDVSRLGAGNNTVELTVTLSGPPEADGHLGPIVTLIDIDGTRYNYAWYGQNLGSHVLEMSVESPVWVDAPGTTPGLDLNGLQHMHLQLDPGGFGIEGAYTVVWENLRLTNVIPEPASVALLAISGVVLGLRRRSVI